MSTKNNGRPVTRAQLHAELQALEDGVKREMRDMEDRLVEKMRDMQTEVLRAFHSWGRPVEIKLRRLPELDERIGLLGERISRLERGDP